MADEELDARVGDLDAKAARVLASGAHRDTAEVREQLRVHLSLLDALRETRREQGEQLTDLRQELHREVGGLRAEVRDGFSTLAVGTAQITALLTDQGREDRDGG